jgi:serine/threonine protein kinase
VSSVRRFKLIKEVGDGTFGSVWRAINKQNGEVVSIQWHITDKNILIFLLRNLSGTVKLLNVLYQLCRWR